MTPSGLSRSHTAIGVRNFGSIELNAEKELAPLNMIYVNHVYRDSGPVYPAVTPRFRRSFVLSWSGSSSSHPLGPMAAFANKPSDKNSASIQ
jgi:hypothetical protein